MLIQVNPNSGNLRKNYQPFLNLTIQSVKQANDGPTLWDYGKDYGQMLPVNQQVFKQPQEVALLSPLLRFFLSQGVGDRQRWEESAGCPAVGIET